MKRANFSVVVALSRSTGHRPALPRSNNPSVESDTWAIFLQFLHNHTSIVVRSCLIGQYWRKFLHIGAIKFSYPSVLDAVKNTGQEDIDQPPAPVGVSQISTGDGFGYYHRAPCPHIGQLLPHLEQLKQTKDYSVSVMSLYTVGGNLSILSQILSSNAFNL